MTPTSSRGRLPSPWPRPSSSPHSRKRRRLIPTLQIAGAFALPSFLASCATRLNSTYTEDVVNHVIVVKSDGT